MNKPTEEQCRRICEELGSDAVVIVSIEGTQFEFAALGVNANGSARVKVMTAIFDQMKRAKRGAS